MLHKQKSFKSSSIFAPTYSILYLPFVGLELVLEFLHQLLHALIGLVVLLRLEDQLLEATLSLTEIFYRLHVALLLLVQLILQLFDLVG